MSVVQIHHPVPKVRPLRLTGQGTGLRILECAFDSHGGHQVNGSSSNWTGHGPPKAGIAVRIRANRPSYALVADRDATDCLSVPMRVRIPSGAPDYVDVDKGLKSPVSQAGYRGFESGHRRQVHGDVRQWQAQRLSIAEPEFDSQHPYHFGSETLTAKYAALNRGSRVRFSADPPISFPCLSTAGRTAVNRLIVVRIHAREPFQPRRSLR